MEFEGQLVTAYEAILPKVAVDLGEAYRRGMVLRVSVELRVRNVRFEETKDGGLCRQHILTLEDAQIVATFPAGDLVEDTGSLSSQRQQSPQEASELGVILGRAGEKWPTDLVPTT